MVRMVLVIVGVFATAVGLLGFRGQKSELPPRHVFWDMKYQGKYTPQGRSPFFGDGRMQRPLVSDTVPYSTATYFADAGSLPTGNDPGRVEAADALRADKAYYDGVNGPEKEVEEEQPSPDGKGTVKVKVKRPDWVATIPDEAVARAGGYKALVALGRERYTISCSVCHGHTGLGGQGDTAHGMTGRYGMVGIANYHQDKYREYPDGRIFDVITNGYNTMAAYGHATQVQHRWAIIAYVRALQLSQYADPALLGEKK